MRRLIHDPLSLGSLRGAGVLLATVLGSWMVLVNEAATGVTLPALGEDLGLGMATLEQAVQAHTIVLVGLMPVGGALGDRYGRRRIFLAGLILFALASVGTALAVDVTTLAAAQVLQGAGGALLLPVSLAIVHASLARGQRPLAIGVWSGLAASSAMVGPLFGGWFTENLGWRWLFLAALPVAVLVLALAMGLVPESRDAESGGRFDALGAVLLSVTVTALAYGLIQGRAVPLVIGLAVGVVFVLLRMRRSPGSVVPVGMFSSRAFTAANVVTLVMGVTTAAVFSLLVVQLQAAMGFSAMAAAFALIPAAVLLVLVPPGACELARRAGPQIVTTSGILVCAASMLWMALAGGGASGTLSVVVMTALFALGQSLVVSPLAATVLAAAGERHAGVASGIVNVSARMGGLLAGAVVLSSPGLTGDGFRTAMLVCVAITAGTALFAFLTIRQNVLGGPHRM